MFVFSAEDVAWSMTEEVTGGNGQVVMNPVGDACEGCYIIGVRALHYDSWNFFAKDYHQKREVKAKAEQSRETQRKIADGEFQAFQE
eukprot:8477138-Pyramimonas_sp.AAC.1